MLTYLLWKYHLSRHINQKLLCAISNIDTCFRSSLIAENQIDWDNSKRWFRQIFAAHQQVRSMVFHTCGNDVLQPGFVWHRQHSAGGFYLKMRKLNPSIFTASVKCTMRFCWPNQSFNPDVASARLPSSLSNILDFSSPPTAPLRQRRLTPLVRPHQQSLD